MDVSISNDTTPGNSPKSPAFPMESGERQNESSSRIIPASAPNSPDNESEVKARAENKDLSLSAKSGKMRDFGEKVRENEAIDRENSISSHRGNAGESGGEMSNLQESSQVPLDKPEPRLEANVKRLEDLKQEAIRRKMDARRREEAFSYPDASASGQRTEMPDGSGDHDPGEGQRSRETEEGIASPEMLDEYAISSRCHNELSKRNRESTLFKPADLARAAGSPVPIERCKAWLMNKASPAHDLQRDCGSCSVALNGDKSAIKCDPCCYLRDKDSGDVTA